MQRYGLKHPDQIGELPWYFLTRVRSVVGAINEARQAQQ